ncbi:MAG: GNAT family N-acetyltransferase [Eubacteriales bacterium]|nr:GNAT family N-acetyltransferase [Eubacteriales bacterium]
MIEGKWFAQGSDIGVALRIREAALGRGRDALDDEAQQVVVYRGGEPVGTARLWWRDGGFRAGDVCVLAQARGEGYGDLLVRLLLYKAMTHNAQSVTVVCPSACAPFFARYGFQPQGGGNPVEMRVLADEISLDCRHCKHQTNT